MQFQCYFVILCQILIVLFWISNPPKKLLSNYWNLWKKSPQLSVFKIVYKKRMSRVFSCFCCCYCVLWKMSLVTSRRLDYMSNKQYPTNFRKSAASFSLVFALESSLDATGKPRKKLSILTISYIKRQQWRAPRFNIFEFLRNYLENWTPKMYILKNFLLDCFFKLHLKFFWEQSPEIIIFAFRAIITAKLKP